MYKFLAKRIHDGFIAIEDVPEKYIEQVKKAYKDMYEEELD